MDIYEQSHEVLLSGADWYIRQLAALHSSEAVLNRTDADRIADLAAKLNAVGDALVKMRHTLRQRHEQLSSASQESRL